MGPMSLSLIWRLRSSTWVHLSNHPVVTVLAPSVRFVTSGMVSSDDLSPLFSTTVSIRSTADVVRLSSLPRFPLLCKYHQLTSGYETSCCYCLTQIHDHVLRLACPLRLGRRSSLAIYRSACTPCRAFATEHPHSHGVDQVGIAFLGPTSIVSPAILPTAPRGS